jgi:nitroimidazol reductase NimA-like FMN-containing flavoprotein (pyridoxamine 5'-phosphate oxidase superfamily)
MAERKPITNVDPDFSSPEATPTPWATAGEQLDDARTYWISTVRPDGRPHVTTIAAVWLDDAIHFVTGKTERKARNLADNTRVVITTGCNGWDGLDIVVEGEAVLVTAAERLRAVVDAFTAKYDDFFGFRFADGRFLQPETADEPLVFEVRATKAFGFAKGDTFSQTRWRFPAPS